MIGMGGGATGLAQAGGATALEATGGLINEYTTPTGNFRTHIFTASGALTISAGKLEAFDYWVVAGGGGLEKIIYTSLVLVVLLLIFCQIF